MADNPVFDSEKSIGSNICKLDGAELTSFIEKLCEVVTVESRGKAFRGGIRPGNIISEDGAIIVGPAGKAGDDGWSKDELEFMAPELFWNGAKSPAADVYSIGLLLYYGLKGRLPFVPETEAEPTPDDRVCALRVRMNGEKITAPDGTDEKLSAVLEKATAFKTCDRYADAFELLNALRAIRGAEPYEAISFPENFKDVEAPEIDDEFKPAEEPEAAEEVEIIEESTASEDPEVIEGEDVNESEEPAAVEPVKEEEPVPAVEPEPVKKAEPTVIEIDVIERKPEKVKAHKVKKSGKKIKRGFIYAAVFVIIAGILIGAAIANIQMNAVKVPPLPTPAPTPTLAAEPSQTPEPTPTPVPTATPAPVEHTYQVLVEDLSWDQAEVKCKELGGHLVTISDESEYNEVCRLLSESGAKYAWIGCYRTIGGELCWVNGVEDGYCNWASGEPSVTDAYDGAHEDYVMLSRTNGVWLYNDSRLDPVTDYAKYYSGKIAYVCEIGE